jgi:branched-chain amino acid transport system substrate-binding protein
MLSSTSRGGARWRGWRLRAGTVLVALVCAACGTRLSHSTIVNDARGGGAVVSAGANGTALGGSGVQAGSSNGFSGSSGGSLSSSSQQSGSSTASGPAGGSGSAGGGGGGTATASASSGGSATGAAGSSSGPTSSASGSPLIIASVGDYSGIAGASEADGPKALQIWGQWVNAHGGVDGGHPVQVIVEDDGMDPSRYQAEIQDLVQNKHVMAFVDNFAPFTIQAGVSYLDKVQVPVIGGDGAEYVWNQSPMLFPQTPSFPNGAYDIPRVAALHGVGKKFGALICEEASACSAIGQVWFQEGAAKRAGMDPVYEANVSIAQPDFTAECLQARQAGVQVMSVVADVNTAARVVESCSRQGFNPQYLQGSGTMNAYLATLPGMQNALVQLNDFPWTVSNNPGVQEFLQAYKTYAPSQPLTPTATQGWAGALLFQTAADMMGSNPSTKALLNALWSLHGNTLGGLAPALTFAKEQPAPPANCSYWMEVQNAKMEAPDGLGLVC